jgi:Mn2+/Fe2+ NRAMP family transporter
MFFVSAAVTAVTGGFLDNLFGIGEHWGISYSTIAGGLLLICALILSIGKYNLLDSLIKIIASVLFLTTLVAFGLTVLHGPRSVDLDFGQRMLTDEVGIGFMIALMGWMPTAVDMSAWNSLWTVARIKQTGYKPSLKETLFDFNLGYIISAILAIVFITMGAYLFYGTGVEMSPKGSQFAHQVITMYTATIGNWSYLIVASAGFAIMFGTCIAVLDGYSRAMDRVVHLMFDKTQAVGKKSNTYSMTLWVVVIGSFCIIYFRGSSIPRLVDFATTMSFLIAPLIAIVNLILVHSPFVEKQYVPPMWLRLLAYCGVLFLIGFSVFFLIQ